MYYVRYVEFSSAWYLVPQVIISNGTNSGITCHAHNGGRPDDYPFAFWSSSWIRTKTCCSVGTCCGIVVNRCQLPPQCIVSEEHTTHMLP
mmetsp:Transcript_11483/g.26631  ORF Transcript_11483/g.26631 Transcript_11483/m.26631 type:complete len:90 (-) Transcript_11483:668-937(-)